MNEISEALLHAIILAKAAGDTEAAQKLVLLARRPEELAAAVGQATPANNSKAP